MKLKCQRAGFQKLFPEVLFERIGVKPSCLTCIVDVGFQRATRENDDEQVKLQRRRFLAKKSWRMR